jgi:hypothetical protein
MNYAQDARATFKVIHYSLMQSSGSQRYPEAQQRKQVGIKVCP